MLSNQAELQPDIALDLSLMRTTLEAELREWIGTAGINPSHQTKRVTYARKALSKCHMAPKQVFSAMIKTSKTPTAGAYPVPSTIPLPHAQH